MADVDLWSFENPVFCFYVLCSTILLFKTLIMAPMTGLKRVKYKSFSTPEDDVLAGLKTEVKPLHPDVQRVIRAHQNDLENIVPFVVIGLLYASTNPSFVLAKLYYAIFTVSRVAHTMIYVKEVPQPARFLAFLVGLLVNFAMLISIIVHVAPLCF